MEAAMMPRPSNDDRIRAALWFVEHGFKVFPCWSTRADGTCRCRAGKNCQSPGKHPYSEDDKVHGFKDATDDPIKIRTFLSAASEPNYGLVNPDGVFSLDVDGEGVAKLDELIALYGPLPPTIRTITAHGQHIFLRWPDDLPRPIKAMFGYVTRWGTGEAAGYVIGPRSVHQSGFVYAPDPASGFEIATLPETWAQAAVGPAKGPGAIVIGSGAYEMPETVTGARYDAILAYTAHLYNLGLTPAEMWPLVRDVLAPRFAEPATEKYIRGEFDRVVNPKMVERLGEPSINKNKPPAPRTVAEIAASSIDAADLMELNLAPLRWVVPGLIPEGTAILAAPPKVGKSCLIYQIAVEAAIGGDLLDRRVTPGSVLYLALEDGQRRGQDRLRTALAGRTMPRGRLEVRWAAARIGGGLEEEISTWLDEHPDAAMVALDTLGKVRPRSTGKQGAYEVDVQDLARLQDLFRNRPVALVIVHHARKEATDDFLTSVSGTYGITGSADTIIAIRRKRLERFGTIYTTGRDIADAEIPVQFVEGMWSSAPAALPAASMERSEIYAVIERRGPIFPQAIADELGLDRTSVQHMVGKLVSTGAVARVSKGYVVPGVQIVPTIPLNIPSHSDHSDSAQSDQGEITRTPVRETTPTGWLRPCRDYENHRSSHQATDAGWICLACDAEDGR